MRCTLRGLVRELEEEADPVRPHIQGHWMERNGLLPLLPPQAWQLARAGNQYASFLF